MNIAGRLVYYGTLQSEDDATVTTSKWCSDTEMRQTLQTLLDLDYVEKISSTDATACSSNVIMTLYYQTTVVPKNIQE